MRKLACCLTIAASAAILAPPTQAQETWTRSVASEPQALEIDSFLFTRSGHGVALWRAFDQARGPSSYTGLSLASVAGVWRRGPDVVDITPAPSEVLSYGRSRLLLVALRPRGRSGQRVRHAPAYAYGDATNGSFGRLRLVSDDGEGLGPAADVNVAGDALVAGSRGSAIGVAERAAGRAFSRLRTRTRRGAAAIVDVAINQRGDRVLTWYRKGYIEARLKRRGHDWGDVARIGRADPYPGRLDARVAPNGRVMVAWGATSIREGHPSIAEARVAIRDGGRWARHRLERVTTTAPLVLDPRAIPLYDSRGLAWLAWTSQVDAGRPVVKLARIRGRVVEPPLTVSAPGGALDDLEGGPQGQLGLSWSATAPGGLSTPFVRLRAASGELGPAVQLTGGGESSIAGTQLAFHPLTGRASVAWLLRTEPRARLAVSTQTP